MFFFFSVLAHSASWRKVLCSFRRFVFLRHFVLFGMSIMDHSKSGEGKSACPSWTSFSVSQYSNPIIKPDSTTCLRILCDKAVDERQLSLLCDIIPGFKRWVMASVVR